MSSVAHHMEGALHEVFQRKYASGEHLGWGPELRLQFQYFTPDDIYEAVLSTLVRSDTAWLDVGCGRDLFPSNAPTAEILAARCRFLVGLDPSDNIDENPYLHRRFKGCIEAFHPECRFDLVTLRMVAEHITDPERMISELARISNIGGQVVVYTVHRWAPVTVISSLVPFCLHHRIKSILWRTSEQDTFPTSYRMNTRKRLKTLFAKAGFTEEYFSYLDDCRSFARWKALSVLELLFWRALQSVGLHYPEVCLLGIYRRVPCLRDSDSPV